MNWKDDSEQLKSDFVRDGFVVLRGFYSSAEVEALNGYIDQYISEAIPQLPSSAAFYEVEGQSETIMRLQNLEEHDSYFAQLNASERFAGLAECLLGDGIVRKNMQWFTKPARSAAETPPHQDGFYFNLEPAEAITLWLALDTINAENGCIRYVRGSHRRGMRSHQASGVFGFSQGMSDYGEADAQLEVPIHGEPGDLIAHHCMMIHRAEANMTNQPRRALGFVYFAQRAKVNKESLGVYKKQLKEQRAKADTT